MCAFPIFCSSSSNPGRESIVEIPADSAKLTPVPRGKPWDFEPQDGTVVGLHQGAHYFTIGQRKGLLVGGKPLPLFVLATDVVRNVVYVGQGEDHPGLYRSASGLPQKTCTGFSPGASLPREKGRPTPCEFATVRLWSRQSFGGQRADSGSNFANQ